MKKFNESGQFPGLSEVVESFSSSAIKNVYCRMEIFTFFFFRTFYILKLPSMMENVISEDIAIKISINIFDIV